MYLYLCLCVYVCLRLCVCVHVCVCVWDNIQVEALADDEVVEGPIYVTINVLDVNNNAPYFNQSVYTALVREHSPAGVCCMHQECCSISNCSPCNRWVSVIRLPCSWYPCADISTVRWTEPNFVAVVPGVPFTRVFASDKDDPETPNAQLSYSLVSQIPNRLHTPLFQINPKTGEISTTEDGTTHTPAHTLMSARTWTQTLARRAGCTARGKISNLSISACNLVV